MSVQESSESVLDGVKLRKVDGEYDILGEGSFAFVVKATYFGAPCAIKLFKKLPWTDSRSAMKRKQADQQIHRLLHPNVVQFLGYYEDTQTGDWGICMERLYKSLDKFVGDSKSRSLPIEYKTSILMDVANAMRDLKPGNVLLTRSLKAKVADFGMARCEDTQVSEKSFKSTEVFMPPEVFPDKGNPQFGYYTDSFSFGCLILYILTYELPVPLPQYIIDHEEDECKGTRTEIERRQPYIDSVIECREAVPFMHIIKWCLSDKYSERPKFDEIHKELSSYNQNYLDDAWVAQNLQDGIDAANTNVTTNHVMQNVAALGHFIKAYSPLPIMADATQWVQKNWIVWCFLFMVLCMIAFVLGKMFQLH